MNRVLGVRRAEVGLSGLIEGSSLTLAAFEEEESDEEGNEEDGNDDGEDDVVPERPTAAVAPAVAVGTDRCCCLLRKGEQGEQKHEGAVGRPDGSAEEGHVGKWLWVWKLEVMITVGVGKWELGLDVGSEKMLQAANRLSHKMRLLCACSSVTHIDIISFGGDV